jgi:hypothetical protein
MSSRSSYVALAAISALLVAGLISAIPHAEDSEVLSTKRVAAVLKDGRVLLTVGLPPASKEPVRGMVVAELLDEKGKTIAEDQWCLHLGAQAAGPAFAFTALDLPPDKVRVRLHLQNKSATVSLADVLLSRGHETTLRMGRGFAPGTKAAFHCEVHGVRSLEQKVPLAGAAVAVRLCGTDGKAWPLYRGTTGIDGMAMGLLQFPTVASGKYTVEVATTSALGAQTLKQDVTLRLATKVWLVSDKPVYQPGQCMHLRALALGAFDLRPAAGESLTFEIEDGKGNKVFKKVLQTSAYGVASTDFELADEINSGEYRVRAIVHEHRAEMIVQVKPYVLPKFRVELTTDRTYSLPGNMVRVDLQANYLFGKPIAQGNIQMTAAFEGKDYGPLETWKGQTDERGHACFAINVPQEHEAWELEPLPNLLLQGIVTDGVGHRQSVRFVMPLARDAIQIRLVSEGGRLVPGVKNRVFVTAVHPDGSPARCNVRIWLWRNEGEPLTEVRTDQYGVAECHLGPEIIPFPFLSIVEDDQIIEKANGELVATNHQYLAVTFTGDATDDRGEQVSWVQDLSCEPVGENLRMHLNGAIFKAAGKARVQIHSTAGLPAASLEIVKAGQVVFSKILQLQDGNITQNLDLPADLSGVVEFHATQVLSSSEVIRDCRLAYIQPKPDLQVEAKANLATYRPGEKGSIHFQVTDGAGRPAQAALGLLIVDEAVYALQDVRPRAQSVYFTLDENLLQPLDDWTYQPAESLDRVVTDRDPAGGRQRLAEVLLARVRPRPPAGWRVDPVLERSLDLQKRLEHIGGALFMHASDGHSFMEKDQPSGKWHFEPGLLETLVWMKAFDEEMLRLPDGSRLTFDVLVRLQSTFNADRLALALTCKNMQELTDRLIAYAHQMDPMQTGKWALPEGALRTVIKESGLLPKVLKDGWGAEMRLIHLKKKRPHSLGIPQFDKCELRSAGPDGVFDTADDVVISNPVS